jgi:glycosyltransferase involved in cell wall biosynthesis
VKIALAAPTEIPARRANTLQVMKMAQALAGLGHDVRLAAPRSPGAPHLPPGEAAWEALRLHYGLEQRFSIEWLPASPRWRRYDYTLRAVQWARGWDADVLYTRLPQAAALASRQGFPTVFEIHDLPQGLLGPRFLRWFVHGSGARRLVVITRALADDLARRFDVSPEGPFTVIAPDGVDIQRYAGLPEPLEARRRLFARLQSRLDPERFTAGYTGHLYAGRGSELLLALARALPEMNFIIAGGEPQDVARLQAQTAGLDNLLLAGFVPNAELPGYQAACDVLLAPYAGRVAASSGGDIARYLSPMKLFEYLACGRAIVSSDLPVLREVLNAGNAVLLPPEDVAAWTRTLRRLCADDAARDQLAGQARRDAAGYTWERRAARIFNDSFPG